MKFAHFAQIFARPDQTAAERYEQLWRELELSDDLGFDFGFASVHHLSHMRPQTTVYVTGATAHTRRMRIGSMGYVAALYDPIRIVEEVAILDNITHGRLEVGIASGVTRDEFRVYGADWDNRQARAIEAMQLLKAAFTSEKPFDFEGPFHKYEEVRMSVEPLQKPYPPLWLITTDPNRLQIGAREGTHTGFTHFHPRQEVGPLIKDYLRTWRESGHQYEPRISHATLVYVDETDEAAMSKGMPHVLYSMDAIYGGDLGGGGIWRALSMEEQGQLAAAEIRKNMYNIEYLLANDIVFVGSPDTVARKIKERAKEGLFNVYAGEFNIGTLPEEDLMRSIRLFGTEVIPALREVDPTKEYMG